VFIPDTDVLIDVQRKHPPAVAWFTALTQMPSVPGLAVMELYQDARNARELREARRLVAPMPVVWPTEADCRKALVDFTRFHLSHNLGLIDSLIAATAVGLGAELATFNAKHYRVVPGLVTVQPYKR
jgi:predicted nucleic acid-binding protein